MHNHWLTWQLHFVHYNISLFKSFEEALKQPNGLCVVGVFVDIGYYANQELNKILEQINDIIYKDAKKLIQTEINIDNLMPSEVCHSDGHGT